MSHLLGVQPLVPAGAPAIAPRITAAKRGLPRGTVPLSRIRRAPASATLCPATNQWATPHLCGFPDSTNTGWIPTGVSLTTYTGPTTISTAGTTLDSFHFTSSITIDAPNCQITRSWFDLPVPTGCTLAPCTNCSDPGCGGCPNGPNALTMSQNASNLLVQDTEFSGGYTAINGDTGAAPDIVVRRCYFHNVGEDGMNIPKTTQLLDSYIGDLNSNCATGGHVQAIALFTVQGPNTGTFLARHCSLRCNSLGPANSAPVYTFLFSPFSPSGGGSGFSFSDWTLDNCLLDGHGGPTGGGTARRIVFSDDGHGSVSHPILTAHITNCRAGRTWTDGLSDIRAPTVLTQSGNVFDNDNTPALF